VNFCFAFLVTAGKDNCDLIHAVNYMYWTRDTTVKWAVRNILIS